MEEKHATERAGDDAGPIADVFTVALFAAGILALLYIFRPMIDGEIRDEGHNASQRRRLAK